MTKPKTIQASIEDLTQNLEQLKLDLKSALEDGRSRDVKDMERAIKLTKVVIDRLKAKK